MRGWSHGFSRAKLHDDTRLIFLPLIRIEVKYDVNDRTTALATTALLSVLAALTFPAWATDSSPIFQAIRDGNIAAVKAHVTAGRIEARDPRGATPLMCAAAFGNVETLRVLLGAGADVNASNDFQATALLWAAAQSGQGPSPDRAGSQPECPVQAGTDTLNECLDASGRFCDRRLVGRKGSVAKTSNRSSGGWIARHRFITRPHRVRRLSVPDASEARTISSVIVATDDERIADAVIGVRRRGADDVGRAPERHRPAR